MEKKITKQASRYEMKLVEREDKTESINGTDIDMEPVFDKQVKELLKKQNISCKSIIICQDATMQNRMDAGLRKYAEKETVIINYAAYAAKVRAQGEKLVFTEEIHGMWDMDRYVNLLMGEIPRLSDDGKGYGPKGKNYIAHVDILEEVRNAFEDLKRVYGEKTREANPLFASRENRP